MFSLITYFSSAKEKKNFENAGTLLLKSEQILLLTKTNSNSLFLSNTIDRPKVTLIAKCQSIFGC